MSYETGRTMNKKAVLKGIGLIATLALTLFAGYMLLIMSMFAGGVRFYTPLILVGTGVLLLFELLFVFMEGRRKWLGKAFRGFVTICVLAVLGRMAYRGYQNRFDVVDTEVDIRNYAPFVADSLAVSLEEPASLRLQEPLPRLDGATALYPRYAAFVRATYPSDEYSPYASEVMCSKTGRAYDRLLEGEADLIFVAKPSQDHLDQAAELGIEMTLTPIGREAFVFFVNQQNSIRGLSTEQIQSIYSGAVTNWQELSGKNQTIRAFQRPENSGSQTLLQSLMEGKTLMNPPTEDVVQGMGGIINQAANYRNYPGAIGYSFRFFASEMEDGAVFRGKMMQKRLFCL
jgi:phosphate transport system substrate-binding protein